MNYRNLATASAVAIASLALAAPASAQVNGIATADRALAVANTQALQTGFEQIATQNQAQLTSLGQLQQQQQTIVRGLDTDGDGQLSEAEQAAVPEATRQQLGTLNQQIRAIEVPIQRARVYVVSQIGQQYAPAVQQVIADRSIQIMLAPDALIYAPESADVTSAITAAMNARATSAQISPPADWQPSQGGVQLYQEIQQLIMYSAMQQQAAAAAQARQGQQPQQQAPAPAQPTGR